MATKKNDEKITTVENEVTDSVIEVLEKNATEEVIEKTTPMVEKKKTHDPTEGIPCKSITTGELLMQGIKSRIVYRWSDCGDITEVEYQDIIAAIRSNSRFVMKPTFIVEDNEIISQFPQLKKLYEGMYSIKEIHEVFNLPVNKMKTVIKNMPEGAKDSVKHMASKMISNGSLDSIAKIKALDEIFGTKLVLMTELYNN